ncbi:hypothetical protein IOCL2690_000435700 [Leishmania lindenbergi]|uniref:Uncharacterized protein n=1 Tax=Leishmania lindenbergi TaxID=651832 RepID=A0AAW3ABL0_9TRYP
MVCMGHSEYLTRRIMSMATVDAVCDLCIDVTRNGWGTVCVNLMTEKAVITGTHWRRLSLTSSITAAVHRVVHCAMEVFSLSAGAAGNLHADGASAIADVLKDYTPSHAVSAGLHDSIGSPAMRDPQAAA